MRDTTQGIKMMSAKPIPQVDTQYKKGATFYSEPALNEKFQAKNHDSKEIDCKASRSRDW